MAEQQPDKEIEKFLDLAVRSGLMSAGGGADAIEGFQRQSTLFTEISSAVGRFCEFLIEKGMLTCWQCDRLREGKYKGFFLDQFKLLKHVGFTAQCAMYEAEDKLQNRRVILRVYPPTVVPMKNGKPHYEVVDQ